MVLLIFPDNTVIAAKGNKNDKVNVVKTTVIPDHVQPRTLFKSYMDFEMVTATSSNQYKLRMHPDTSVDANGWYTHKGFPVIAVHSRYAKVGDLIRVEFVNGEIWDCVVGDIKGIDAEDQEWGIHAGGGSGSIVEFVVSTDKMPVKARQLGSLAAALKIMEGAVKSISTTDWDNTITGTSIAGEIAPDGSLTEPLSLQKLSLAEIEGLEKNYGIKFSQSSIGLPSSDNLTDHERFNKTVMQGSVAINHQSRVDFVGVFLKVIGWILLIWSIIGVGGILTMKSSEVVGEFILKVIYFPTKSILWGVLLLILSVLLLMGYLEDLGYWFIDLFIKL